MPKLSNFVTRKWVTAKGEKRECYYYRRPRSEGRKEISLGSDYPQALKKYANIVGAETAKPPPETIAAVYTDYMTWAENRKISNLSLRTISDRKYYWKNLSTVFGHCNIDDFQPEWALTYFEERSSQVSAKKELKFLSVIFNWARARGKMHTPNPCLGIMAQLTINETREIYVEDTWYQLALKHSCQMVKDVLEFTLIFANRPAETQAAMFQHIEDDELVIELQKTKGKGLKEKRIPLDGARLEFINRQKANPVRSFYIVSDNEGQRIRMNGNKFKAAWKKARDKAQTEAKQKNLPFERFQLRDIRAKAATDIARDHGIEAARLMLGHTTQKQTAAYIRSVKGAAKIALKTQSG